MSKILIYLSGACTSYSLMNMGELSADMDRINNPDFSALFTVLSGLLAIGFLLFYWAHQSEKIRTLYRDNEY